MVKISVVLATETQTPQIGNHPGVSDLPKAETKELKTTLRGGLA